MHRVTSRPIKSADGSMTFRDPPKKNMESARGPLDIAFSWKGTWRRENRERRLLTADERRWTPIGERIV
jgi:hypothetical protein